MSEDQHCPNAKKHVQEVRDALAKTAEHHGEKLLSFVAVIICEDGPRCIGMFNNTDLGLAIEEVLEAAAQHVPSGCRACDGTADAAMVALGAFRAELKKREITLAPEDCG